MPERRPRRAEPLPDLTVEAEPAPDSRAPDEAEVEAAYALLAKLLAQRALATLPPVDGAHHDEVGSSEAA